MEIETGPCVIERCPENEEVRAIQFRTLDRTLDCLHRSVLSRVDENNVVATVPETHPADEVAAVLW